AVDDLKDACELLIRLHPEREFSVMDCSYELGWLALQQQDTAAAQRWFTAAAQPPAAHEAEEPSLRGLARAHLARLTGDHEAAARTFARLRDELSLETEPWWRRIPVIDAELGYALATRDLGEIEEARAAFARAGIDLLLLLIDHPSAVRARRLAFIERVLTTVPDWVPDSAPDSP
ncbi:MAG TPA: hypothetical protein VK427_06135, partial [Kofleriaceae bacterium]|nr:hypothetical protein [Kofleriaceae bacterium]